MQLTHAHSYSVHFVLGDASGDNATWDARWVGEDTSRGLSQWQWAGGDSAHVVGRGMAADTMEAMKK